MKRNEEGRLEIHDQVGPEINPMKQFYKCKRGLNWVHGASCVFDPWKSEREKGFIYSEIADIFHGYALLCALYRFLLFIFYPSMVGYGVLNLFFLGL